MSSTSGLTAHTRAAATLLVAAGLMVVGFAWGLHALTRPFSSGSAQVEVSGGCQWLQIAAGSEVTPDQVRVSVLNASNRDGLAGSVMEQLTDRGFVAGATGNSTVGDVRRVQIWSSDPTSPATLLVASAIPGEVEVVDHAADVPGVVIVVGPRFRTIGTPDDSVRANVDATICG